ncbi:MAG: MerR family transcriptional regulator [Lachnospiraceae bacterium]|nr:MerR family transcriptional regulator [Lachnospiraceae bacterium]
MMTIKEFARLCKCNTQTLRYYDKIDLLKPVKVDQWSGYRYYIKAQAIDFVKIKNLQAADFTIDEIKSLLAASDQQVYEAFDLKILEQAQKLERIKQIQQSYLAEKSNMENIIQGVSGFLTSQMTNFELLREFGLTPGDGPDMVKYLKEFFEHTMRKNHPDNQNISMKVMGESFNGTEAVAERIKSLDTECLTKGFVVSMDEEPDVTPVVLDDYETIWERHGWEHVHEFLEELPVLEKEEEYCLLIQRDQSEFSESLEFSLFMIAVILRRQRSPELKLNCLTKDREDGRNSFSLMRRK